jgi:hypothetical protein
MTDDFERLQLVMSINNSFQANIRHADTKIGMLAVACSAMATTMLTQADAIREALHGSNHPLGFALAAWTVLLAYAALHLAHAVRPRTEPPSATNHFALTSAHAPDIRSVRPDVLCDEATALGRTLADIAARKYGAVTSALYATAGLGVLTALCCALTTLAA